MYSFSYLEPVCCSMSSSNCWFLTCIQVSQEAGHVVWYSHLFQNFPQFIVIHTVKGFGIVKKAVIDVFLELSCFFDDLADVGNLISGSSWLQLLQFSNWNLSIGFPGSPVHSSLCESWDLLSFLSVNPLIVIQNLLWETVTNTMSFIDSQEKKNYQALSLNIFWASHVAQW